MSTRPLSVHRVLGSNRQLAELLEQAKEHRNNHERIRRHLPANLAAHVSGALFEDGRLVLLTDSPVWASRLRFIEPRLRTELGHDAEIRVKVLPSGGRGRKAKKRPRKARSLSSRSAEQIRIMADAISDQQLSQALRRLASHSDGD